MIPRNIALLVLGIAARVAAAERANVDDLETVRAQVTEMKHRLGDQAGVPEVPDSFQPIPQDATWLSPAEAQAAFARALPKIERLRWWKPGLDPTHLTHALREPAAVVSGGVEAYRAKLDGGDRALALAREAAEFLLSAQAEAGTGGFPFPATRGGSSTAPFKAAAAFLDRAEREGKLDVYVRHGWLVDDGADGGLQFDNGEAGIALLDLFAVTHERRYLDAAKRAADWAANHRPVKNWNYNSFSVDLLARAFAATGEERYLAAAKRKALVAVIPGQLTDGPRAGRWLDPHNARPAYHYIMLRALTSLLAVLRSDDPSRPALLHALQLGLRARNQDFIGPGAPNKDKAMEALILVQRTFAKDPAFLDATLSSAALEALGKLVSAQYRRGADPLGPREWPLFLGYAQSRSTTSAAEAKR